MRGSGRIFKRGGAWWIAFCHRGQEKRESVEKHLRASGFARPATDDDARKLLKYRLKEVAADSLGLKPFIANQERLRVSDLLDALETNLRVRGARSLPSLRCHIKTVVAALGDLRAVDVSAQAVDRYIENRKLQNVANATVNRETQLLSQAFRLAVEQQRIGSAPKVHKLSEKENARQGFFEKSDFDELVKHLPKYLKNFTRFAYASGWRRGELCSLQWVDVDMAGRVIRLRADNSKTKEGRVLALAGELWNVISEQWKLREFRGPDKIAAFSLYVFHRKGGPIGEFRKAWASACKAAKLEGRLFHDFRRTAVRNMVRAGVPEKVAMSISGHKTRSIFDRYNIVNEDDLRSAMEKTEQYLKLMPGKSNVTTFKGKRTAGK